jgi:hypothetical protein
VEGQGGGYRLEDSLAQPLARQISKETGHGWKVVPLAEFK